MKARLIGCWLLVSGMAALLSSAQGQIIEFRAAISGAQEAPTPTPSTATGTATLLYDVSANTFDLFVTINGMANTLTLSHIHEGAVGVAGPVVTDLGNEAASYVRNGTTLTGTFRGKVHGGNKLTLLRNGAYLNFHTQAFGAGEIRGQLIAQPKRLTALITPAQEIAAAPIVSNAFGAAIMSYNPGTNRIDLQVTLYNFANTLTLSHYHEAPVGVNGPVVTNLGGAVAYKVTDRYITQVFSNLDYGAQAPAATPADPIRLLTGGAYLNFHSNVYGGGEIRGQVRASDDVPSSRLINASVRGLAGTGGQVLIAGLAVTGNEPVAIRVIARGPSLAQYGLTGVLADPSLAVYSAAGVLMATNDNHGLVAPAVIPVGLDARESVVDLILPPGAYTAVVSGVGGTTGLALIESFELRNGTNATIASLDDAPLLTAQTPPPATNAPSRAAAMEICTATLTPSSK